MNDQSNAQNPSTPEPPDGNTITPLPGEPGIPQVTTARSTNWSRKGALGLGMMVLTLVLFAGFAINRYLTSGPTTDEDARLVRDKPSAASAGTRALDMTAPRAPRVPALLPITEAAEPIGVRSGGPASPKGLSADDAPVLIVSSRPGGHSSSAGRPNATVPDDASANPDDPVTNTSRNLESYQKQLQGLLDNLTQSTAMAGGQGGGPANLGALGSMAGALSGAGLFGGQLQGSATPKIAASTLGDRSPRARPSPAPSKPG